MGYKERRTVLEPKHASRLRALLSPVIEVDGIIQGTWTRRLGRNMVVVESSPFRRLRPAEKVALASAAGRYGKFLGVTATLF